MITNLQPPEFVEARPAKILTVVERIKREALSKALLRHIQNGGVPTNEAQQVKEQFIAWSKEKTGFTQSEVREFCLSHNLPETLMQDWQLAMRALFEPVVKVFLQSLDLESKSRYLQALAGNGNFLDFLEQFPEITAYANVEILDLDIDKQK